jgi:Rho GTPase-activating protein 1
MTHFPIPIPSNKFAKKIEAVDSLEELGKFLPIEKVFIPPLVTGYDRGMPPVPAGHNVDILPAVKIFGAEVERAAPTGEVPAQIQRVFKQLEETGLQEEGLFRLSPDEQQVEQIRISMDRDYDIDLKQFSPHALAAAIKAYFRQLPTPLIPPNVYNKIGGVFGTTSFHCVIKR